MAATRQEMPARVRALYDQRRQAAEARGQEARRALAAQDRELAALDEAVTAAEIARVASLTTPGADPQAAQATLERLRRERRARVRALGHDPALFDGPRPSCLYCGDTGFDGEARCRCYPEVARDWLLEHSGLPEDDLRTFEHFDASLFSATVPEGDGGRRRLSTREQRELQRRFCESWCERFPEVSPRNLFMSGGTGTGKTWFCAAIGHALIARGHSVVYVTAPALFQRIAEYRRLSTSYNPDSLRLSLAEEDWARFHDCDCLIIDDLGTETNPPATRLAELLGLINARLADARALVISSNLDIKHISERYDERIASRLIGGFELLDFRGEDLRLAHRQRLTQ